MTKNDILARLKKGESIDDIASEITKAMNEAEKEFKAQSLKKSSAEKVANAVNGFLYDYYPDMAEPFTAEEIIELFDSLDNIYTSIGELMKPVQKEEKKKPGSDEDLKIIEEWLRAIR